jgi:hypothetical protein
VDLYLHHGEVIRVPRVDPISFAFNSPVYTQAGNRVDTPPVGRGERDRYVDPATINRPEPSRTVRQVIRVRVTEIEIVTEQTVTR